ncbi:MAG: hypothetical protein DRN27_09320 [Thermoplasmata archaeon]|nr:MAG: hypothetical protein DRN27_09320 [Thermoplasmata archaeon]
MTDKHFSIDEFSYEYLEEIFNPTKRSLNRIKYINNYFEGLKTERKIKNITIVKENDYIDKFYLRDYSRYYAESFHRLHNRSERLHFFSKSFSEKEFSSMIISGSTEKFIGEKREYDYLGHLTLKPVKDQFGSKLIGRTAISPYPEKQAQNTRHYITTNNKCSLFGIDLKLKSLPFHEQDIAVGACASACLWMTQFPIQTWYDIPIRSIAEITELSRLQGLYDTTPAPLFPSEGLTPSEIASYLEKLGLHFQIFDINALINKKIELKTKQGYEVSINQLIEDIIKAYSNSGFPIICNLDMGDYGQGHAVLISGYKEDKNGEIIELYLHDDKIGPYCRTKFHKDYKTHWFNHWTDSKEVSKIQLRKFIIPVDPLVKLHYLQCFEKFYSWKHMFERIEYKLYHVSKYRNAIFTKKFQDKQKILSKNMPRYIWVAHIYDDDKNHNTRDAIFDANRIYLRKPETIIEFN